MLLLLKKKRKKDFKLIEATEVKPRVNKKDFLTQELNWGLLHCRWESLPAELPGMCVCVYVCESHSVVSDSVTPWTV